MNTGVDCHTHPFQGARSYDGMRLFAESAVRKGLAGIIFTEHAPLAPAIRTNPHYLNEREYELYLECAQRCRREYADRLTVKIGIEADFHPWNLEQVARFRKDNVLEYIGGSLHLHAEFWADRIAGMTEDEKIRYALRQTLEMVNTGLFTGINHLDFFRWRCPGYDPIPFEEQFREIFEAMVKHGLSLELNTSGMHKAFRSFLPCAAVWKWSLDYPLKRTFGSDAHTAELVGDHAGDLALTGFPPG